MEDNVKTDKQKLIALLTEFGVSFKNETYGGGDSSVIVKKSRNPHAPQNNVTGYEGFFTSFQFDSDDKFIQMGAWE